MKIKILVLLIIVLLPWQLRSQTADAWIIQGRSYLAAHDLANANNSFAQALTASPTNQAANAFYAITRLLVLPGQPPGSNFLTRIGFPVAGRNIYNWTSTPPTDANGLVLAPAGVDANEFTAQTRTNVLAAVAGAIGNLSTVTDPSFTVNLTSTETATVGVIVDYGDLKLIQAGLYATEYFIDTLNSQNLDAQLTSIRALYTNGMLSAGQVLAMYPQLFTFATTNDLQNAYVAFADAVSTYMTASAIIRARPAGHVRLFNYDPQMARIEGDFRLTLQDLKNSLVLGPQILWADPDLMVDLSPQFEGNQTWRSLLPVLDANAIELGSLPDLTFGGMVYGLTQDEVESSLGKYFTMLPVGRLPQLPVNNSFNITFTTLRGHHYALQTSTNLSSWNILTNFAAPDDVSTFSDLPSSKVTSRFYRLRDDTGF